MIKQLVTSVKSKLFPSVMDKLLKIEGWTQKEQLEYLMQRVKELPDNSVIVEIGVWQGRSALAMGEACRGTGKRIYAVDPWIDYETKKGLLSSRLSEFGVDSVDSVYDKFLTNLSRFELKQWIEPIKATSIDVAATWSRGECDFVFIDGDHNYEPVLADLRAWTRLARKGAVIAGDDWQIDSVQSAVKDFIADNPGLSLNLPCVNTWEFQAL